MDVLVVVGKAIEIHGWCIIELKAETFTAPCMVGEVIIEVLVFPIYVIYVSETFLFLNVSSLLVF